MQHTVHIINIRHTAHYTIGTHWTWIPMSGSVLFAPGLWENETALSLELGTSSSTVVWLRQAETDNDSILFMKRVGGNSLTYC